MEKTEKFTITRITRDQKQTLDDTVVTEVPLTIFLNGEEYVTIICTPGDYLELAIGYLFSERIIQKRDDIISSTIDENRGIAQIAIKRNYNAGKGLRLKRFITPSCFFYTAYSVGGKKVESTLKLSVNQVLNLMKLTLSRSGLYKQTGGVHSAALCDSEYILLFSEDIGRHNAIDKILGMCLLQNISPAGKVLVTSGRISSALTVKIINARIPIIISGSAPTSEAIKLSGKFGVTLIGFVRGRRINIYSNEWRIG